MVTDESPASRFGHITLDRKPAGKPIAGNRHDGFEVAGAGNQLTVWLVKHSQRKRGEIDRPNLRSMAPVLDPTRSILSLTDSVARTSATHLKILYSKPILCPSLAQVIDSVPFRFLVCWCGGHRNYGGKAFPRRRKEHPRIQSYE